MLGVGDETIWGEADSVSPFRGDIPAAHVSTAGHGGYAVEAAWAMRNLSPECLGDAFMREPEFGYIWFEEDADWCLPVLDNADFAAAAAEEWHRGSNEPAEANLARLRELARETAGRWHGEYLAYLDAIEKED